MKRTGMKILSVITAVLLATVWLPSAALAEEETIHNSRYDHSVWLLKAVNHFEKAEGEEAKLPVTRAVFADTLMRFALSEAERAAFTPKKHFSDVDEDYWAFDAVSYAVQYGMVSPYAKFFNPENSIKVDEAFKMAVIALGYDQLALVKGGYPSGYLWTANHIKLDDGVSITEDGFISYQGMSILIANLLQTEVLLPATNEEGDHQKAGTMLEEKYHIRYRSGVVTANAYTGLVEHTAGVKEGYLEIDDVLYETSVSGDAFIGQRVGFYYDYKATDNGGAGLIKTIYTATNVNKITIDQDKLIRFSDNSYRYENEKGKEETYSVSASASIIYNGKAADSKVNMMPEYGNVALYDNDGNGSAETVIIYDYQTIIVDNVTENPATIWGTDGTAIVVDDKSSEVLVTIGGERAELSTIAEWAVLNIAQSANIEGKKLVTVCASFDTLSAPVSEVGTDSLTVDGTVYKWSPSFDTKLVIGTPYTILLDSFGRVAGVKESERGPGKYGYATMADVKPGVQNKFTLRIFTEDGKMESLEAAESVIIDGMKTKDIAKINEAFLEAGVFKDQLIKYEVNKDNKLIMIDTKQKNVISNFPEKDTLEPSPYNGTAKTFQYLLRSNYFAESKNETGGNVASPVPVYRLNPQTVIFSVPVDVTKEERFAIWKTSSITDKAEFETTAYDSDGITPCGAVVIRSGGAMPMYRYSLIMFVNEVRETVDEIGTTMYKVNGIYDGAEASYLCDPEIFPQVKNVEQGDILQILINESTNELSAMEYVMKLHGTYSEAEHGKRSFIYFEKETGIAGSSLDTAVVYFGRVAAKDGATIKLRIGNKESAKYTLINTGAGKIMTYDERRGYQLSSSKSIVVDESDNTTQWIFSHVRAGGTYETVIYDFSIPSGK